MFLLLEVVRSFWGPDGKAKGWISVTKVSNLLLGPHRKPGESPDFLYCGKKDRPIYIHSRVIIF